MEFLVVILGLLIIYLLGPLPKLQTDLWYPRWITRLNNSIPQRQYPNGHLVVALLLPIVGIVLLNSIAEDFLWGLLWLALNIALLIYALGRGDLKAQVANYLSAVGRNDSQAAYHDASDFHLSHRPALAENWGELHSETLRAISYRYFEHYFAVIFWFVFLGAPGAVLYRLSFLHADLPNEEESETAADNNTRSKPEQWLWLMEWLPARLMGLILAIVGNFSGCFQQWQASLLDKGSSTAETLHKYLEKAVDFPEKEGSTETAQRIAQVSAVQVLYSRGLVLMLSLVAFWVIFI